MSLEKNIYKGAGGSYFLTSRLLPKAVRDDMFKLYSFVRTVKDFATALPPNLDTFEYIERRWQTIKLDLVQKNVTNLLDDSVSERVLANIAYLTHRHGFDPAWVDDFLKSMRWDLQKHQYRSLKDLSEYMYGSSEVVALMMAQIIGLPEESMKAARLQGRAMQYITFLRDIAPDCAQGRSYFPANDIKKYGLKNLSEQEARSKPGMFTDFIHAELLRYAQWQNEANEGFAHIPRRVRVPLQTLIDTQTWTAQQLKYNPLAVFEAKQKPPRRQIIKQAVRNTMAR